MPSSSVALAAPLYELRALLGNSLPDHTAATAMDGAQGALSDIAAALGRSWDRAAVDWSGTAATAAGQFTAGAAAEVTALAERAQALGAAARDAGSAVAQARLRLQAIIDRFEERAAELTPHLDEPGVAQELQAEARRAITEATTVVDELTAELDKHSGSLTAPAPALPPATGMHPGSAGFPAPLGSGGFTAAPAGFTGGAPAAASLGADRSDAPLGLRDPGMFGDGVAVRLPDGSTATAPNAVAAGAVRHALTQLGVPYRWGGTTPGVGLDCSGLTQWAYHEAGLDIPRLAQEQDIGKAVSAGSLRPGDLAVWDGHVAMIVGGNTMIEAGDPVKLSPIRTTNAGQGFQGFWRPTA
ncbi:C40 family peptidase [Mycolicibacterium boenickei]|uniref:C40 family peptidase n=1 Tax=Mycolicibacterium boenickei TaxID=146017 RepID=A0AAX2ZSZ2_9MYCO|nr:C40 family peptidase [Mycolicibacterium boenickei]PEG62718.1 glycoside hydrolase [Mycolicibacterium boenickei]UNB98276.1 C40 family peptidase [Mycolicibacterium boenickei]BBX94055.1 glycoside hydrolase [Mycolicibacterium boenickei]